MSSGGAEVAGLAIMLVVPVAGVIAVAVILVVATLVRTASLT